MRPELASGEEALKITAELRRGEHKQPLSTVRAYGDCR